jgi:hypothetical protein
MCCLQLQGRKSTSALKIEVMGSSETLVPIYQATLQKTVSFIATTMRTLNLAQSVMLFDTVLYICGIVFIYLTGSSVVTPVSECKGI